MKKVLMPRSDTIRWQVYPSDAEALGLNLVMKYSNIDKELYMLRIMINYFIEYEEKKLDLIRYAQMYAKPKYDITPRSKKKVAVVSQKKNMIEEDVIEEVKRLLEIVKNLDSIED